MNRKVDFALSRLNLSDDNRVCIRIYNNEIGVSVSALALLSLADERLEEMRVRTIFIFPEHIALRRCGRLPPAYSKQFVRYPLGPCFGYPCRHSSSEPSWVPY